MKIESRIGKLNGKDEKAFEFLTDFNNFKGLIPQDKVKDFKSDTESCSFSVPGIGRAGLKIVEKERPKLVKIQSDEQTTFDFSLWIQLKQVTENDARVKITVEPQLNPMVEMMAKKPLKQFVDTLVNHLEQVSFQ
jgi:carbon monoxide dehydrogenase subunit G